MALLFNEPYKYVLDSSALLDLKRLYPRDIFVSVWDNFNKLCDSLIIISVKEVYNEIKRGSDWLTEWADDNRKIFFEPQTVEEFQLIGELQEKNPSWIDPNSTRPKADPFVIACANAKNLIIVQHEKYPKNLPKVAKDLNIKCMTLTEFFANEGWKF